MKVDVYIIEDPEEPGRAFVAGWPPVPERAKALEARGARLSHVVVDTDVVDGVNQFDIVKSQLDWTRADRELAFARARKLREERELLVAALEAHGGGYKCVGCGKCERLPGARQEFTPSYPNALVLRDDLLGRRFGRVVSEGPDWVDVEWGVGMVGRFNRKEFDRKLAERELELAGVEPGFARAFRMALQPVGNCDGSGRYREDPTKPDKRGEPLPAPCPGCRACR